MQEGYLTIGQVSRIKKVSIKALRYYEKIGILVPDKIDAATGYRYYASEQMLAVDMILFLQALNIPLKQWHTYIDDKGRFHLEQLINDGKETAYEQICRLHSIMNRLELASRGIKDNSRYEHTAGFYERKIPGRNLLCCPIASPTSAIEFHEGLSFLFEIAAQYNTAANYPSGMLLDYDHGARKYFAYVECFEQVADCPYFRHFPEQTYLCLRQTPRSIYSAHETQTDYFQKNPAVTIIEADCIPSAVYFQPYPVELQFPLSVEFPKLT